MAGKRRNWKKRGLITLCVVAGLVLLSLPTVFFPENEVLYSIAYGPLTVLWVLFYLFLFLLLLLFVLFFINGAHGGYTDGGWKAMGLSVVICLAVTCGLGWLLTQADFVPFSEESFSVPFFSDLFPNRKTVDGFTFTIKRSGKKNAAVLESYEGEGPVVVIPSFVEDAAVVRIADKVFLQREGIEVIVLPKYLESIGSYAFTCIYEPSVFAAKPSREYNWEDAYVSYPTRWYVLEEPAGRETVLFGSWEQDGDASDGTEPIEWLVLAEKDDRQLLLSRYVLDEHRYDDADSCRSWEDSGMKQWLNTSFAENAFSAEERSRLGPEGVFLLTKEQAEKYLPEKEDRKTRSSLALLIRTGRIKSYGASSSGYTNKGITPWLVRNENDQPVEVTIDGAVIKSRSNEFVRPAVWIRK